MRHVTGIGLRAARGRGRGRFSAGTYAQIDQFSFIGGDPPSVLYRWSMAYWTNFDTGLEFRFAEGFSLRPAVGIAFLMNPNAAQATGSVDPTYQPVGDWQFYTGVAVGYAF